MAELCSHGEIYIFDSMPLPCVKRFEPRNANESERGPEDLDAVVSRLAEIEAVVLRARESYGRSPKRQIDGLEFEVTSNDNDANTTPIALQNSRNV
jgi:hypothetical protein